MYYDKKKLAYHLQALSFSDILLNMAVTWQTQLLTVHKPKPLSKHIDSEYYNGALIWLYWPFTCYNIQYTMYCILQYVVGQYNQIIAPL